MANKKYIWTDDQINWLKDHYANSTIEECILNCDKPKHVIYNTAHKIGLYKSKEQISSYGFELQKYGSKTRFKKGNKPMNKGLKQSEYMSPASIERTKATRFKKGNVPNNHRPVGSTRITKDGYVEVKVSEPNVWDLAHRLVWIKTNGDIPPGHNIQFKDKNRLNIDPVNLYIISRDKQIVQNSINRYPEEIKQLIRAIGKLNKKIKQHGT